MTTPEHAALIAAAIERARSEGFRPFGDICSEDLHMIGELEADRFLLAAELGRALIANAQLLDEIAGLKDDAEHNAEAYRRVEDSLRAVRDRLDVERQEHREEMRDAGRELREMQSDINALERQIEDRW